MKKLEKRVAVITGAGRNIGEAIAETLAAEGALVAVVDLDAELGGKVARPLWGRGRVFCLRCGSA